MRQRRHRGSFLEVRSPTASSREEAATRAPGFPRPDLDASSGFRNLLTPYSASALPALFHAGPAPGVHPSELCSSRSAVRRLRRRAPLVVDHPRPNGDSPAPTRRCSPTRRLPVRRPGQPRLQGLALSASPVPNRGRFRSPRARSSPGLRLSRAFTLAALPRPSPGLPPRGCHAGPHADPA